jgi:hypothetical protein
MGRQTSPRHCEEPFFGDEAIPASTTRLLDAPVKSHFGEKRVLILLHLQSQNHRKSTFYRGVLLRRQRTAPRNDGPE